MPSARTNSAFFGRNGGIAPAPRILVAIGTAVNIERQMIEGALRFARATCPDWEFEFARPFALQDPLTHAAECDAILGYIAGSVELAARLSRQNKPTGLIEEYVHASFPRVLGDNFAIGQMGFEHLRSKGFRRFGFLGWIHSPLFCERQKGFEAAVRAAGLELVESPRFDVKVELERGNSMRPWLIEAAKPIGVLVGNTKTANHVASLCRAAGILVPEDIAVLGVDNEPLLCEVARPPLSSIDHGMERAGYEAAALIHRMLGGESPPAEPIIVPPLGVLERQSTDTLAVADADVRTAVTLIRRHATSGMSVKQLLELLPMSRRKLELGFRKHLGRGIHEEIMRIRLERAKFLLRTTEMAVPQIAEACGFQYPARMNELFRQLIGTTPTKYRREYRGG